MKIVKFILLLTAISILSCTEEVAVQEKDMDLSDLSFEGIQFGMKPVVVNLKEYPLEQLYSDLATELFAKDNNEAARTEDEGIYGVDLTIDYEKDEVTITPLDKESLADGDDEKCGGKEGDGWKSYGTCMSESCVKETLEEASKDLGEPGLGECLDLRVRRSTFNARVCGRMVDC